LSGNRKQIRLIELHPARPMALLTEERLSRRVRRFRSG
jgi:hypothetical protein